MIPEDHPRFHSLMIRHRLEEGMWDRIVAPAGLIAHGRGEAFDYIIGEITTDMARRSIRASAALFLLSERPVISVNGNVAVLVPDEIRRLSEILDAPVEINLFYRSEERIRAIEEHLRKYGLDNIYGCEPDYYDTIPELSSNRRIVDRRGILVADTVFVPLEDGDRTEALKRMGKRVITVDLNPMSRTSLAADITIVDNITRCLDILVDEIKGLKNSDEDNLRGILSSFDNRVNLKETLNYMSERLRKLTPGDLS